MEVNGKHEEGYNIFIGGIPGLSGQIANEYASSVAAEDLLSVVEGLIGCWIKNRSDEQETFNLFANRFDFQSMTKHSG